MSLGIAYMKYVPVFAVFCAHIISSHQVIGYFSRNFTFVENDEQTHKLGFCHSKEARSFTTHNAQRAERQHEERGSVSLCFTEWPWNKREAL